MLLYLLAQNPSFPDQVRPIMEKLENSESAVNFLKQLSNFSDIFKNLKKENDEEVQKKQNEKEQEKNPPSHSSGIADNFIEKNFTNFFKTSPPNSGK